MIYEGKEYKAVTDGSAEIGDLLSTTKVSYKDGQFSHFDKLYYFALDNEQYPLTERTMQNGYRIKVYPPKPFKRYRYVKDIEETPVKFKSGDRVRLTEFELNGQINFGNFNGYVDGEKFDGDYKVKFDDGAFGFFPPTSLELIKSYTIGQLKACEDFKKMIDELKAIGPLRNDVGVTPTNAVPKNILPEKVLKSPLEKEKNIPLTDSLRYSACNAPAYKLKRSIKKLYEEMSELITAKNENYGDSFSKQYQKYGMVSVEMRLNDKFMRLEQLVAGEKDKVGESIEDTLKDIIGYATLALIELECDK
ncbi:gp58 [Brochothrix phage BL3]|uniref:gp58 n=1 Tax=Brochothrix phage BL3 TaxID=764562 RepID=UPI0001D9AEE5|nr:gp58 [Brochothrix phage BL3]ADH03139.1 gp58 [Brochothrix phage BL3]